jgi:biopolymer transport protein ExbD
MDDEDELAGAERRKARRERLFSNASSEHAGELNIVALMDAFTIILVFLIKSYASDPTQIIQAPDMRPPQSTTEKPTVDAISIVISTRAVTVNDAPVLRLLDDGRLDPADLHEGVLPGVLSALQDAAQKRALIASKNERVVKEDVRLTVVADRRTPFGTLSAVLATSKKAKLDDFKLAVLRADQ